MNDFTNLSRRLVFMREPVFTVEKVELFSRMFKNFSPEYNGGVGKKPLIDFEIKKQSVFYVVA